ncbi:MAG: hypothetical protein N2663_06575 [Chlorobi bacterium]|nr:hypothetical protein [Chlorobiota bacterium]
MRESGLSLSNSAIEYELRRIQRKHWLRYVTIESLLGLVVGYYALPRIQLCYAVVGVLALFVGVQLSLLRQHRRTWQSDRIVRLLDAIERLGIGTALFALCVYVLLDSVPHGDFVATLSWTGFWIVAGSAGGEYRWQYWQFPTLGRVEQVRYLCRCGR